MNFQDVMAAMNSENQQDIDRAVTEDVRSRLREEIDIFDVADSCGLPDVSDDLSVYRSIDDSVRRMEEAIEIAVRIGPRDAARDAKPEEP